MNVHLLNLIYSYFKSKYDAAETQLRYYNAVGGNERDKLKAELYKEVYNNVLYQINLCAKVAKNDD